MTTIHDLPENGRRAAWFTDSAWRDALALSLPGLEINGGFGMLPLDGGLGELAIYLYGQGVFVLTEAKLEELDEIVFPVPVETQAQSLWPN